MNDWVTLAKMVAGDPTVVGFDLRNEPHTPAGDTYAEGATWGTGDASTDIRLAYEQAGNAILAADPDALIFCEGISENPTASGGTNSTWWGGDLAEAGQYPVTLSSPGHVVYSAHDYGPSLFQQTWFNSVDHPGQPGRGVERQLGLPVRRRTSRRCGSASSAPTTPRPTWQSSAAGSQGQWFESLVAYLAANPWMGWTYWALNGEDSYDLLDSNYDPTPVSALKQSLLAAIQFPLPGAGNGTPPPTGSAAPVSCSAAYSLTNTWAGGFQAPGRADQHRAAARSARGR